MVFSFDPLPPNLHDVVVELWKPRQRVRLVALDRVDVGTCSFGTDVLTVAVQGRAPSVRQEVLADVMAARALGSTGVVQLPSEYLGELEVD
eukprot:s7350_g1.t1